MGAHRLLQLRAPEHYQRPSSFHEPLTVHTAFGTGSPPGRRSSEGQVSRRLRSVHDSSQHPCPSPRTRRSRRGRHPPRGPRVDCVSDDSTRLDDPGGRVGGARRHGRRRRRRRPGGALAAAHGGGPGQPHRPAGQLGELRRDPAVVPRQVPRHRQPGADPGRLVGRRAHGRRDRSAARTRCPTRSTSVRRLPCKPSRRASGTRTCRPCGTRSPTR